VNAAAVNTGAVLRGGVSLAALGSGAALFVSAEVGSNAIGVGAPGAAGVTPSATLRLACSAFFSASINKLMDALR
jgi:hypothetical protein